MPDKLTSTVLKLSSALDDQSIPYFYIDQTALWLQGVMEDCNSITVSIQWDGFESVISTFNNHYGQANLKHTDDKSIATYNIDDYPVSIQCEYNTVIRTNPYLIHVPIENRTIPSVSLYHYQRNSVWTPLVNNFLRNLQDKITQQNEQAWNQQNYEALLNRHGAPKDVADKLLSNPSGKLKSLLPYLPELKEKRIANLMGSHGMKATAMGLLGADVTVIDFSYENERYAKELSQAASVDLTYYISDILNLGPEHHNQYDIVVMELGILHYFLDLHPLFHIVNKILKPGGHFILQEFHPISTKLITSKGKKHKVDGNYFDPTIQRTNVAYSKHLTNEKENANAVLQRKWTLGEVLTSLADEELIIKQVVEEPNIKMNDRGIPKLFTVRAERSN
ncbi:class I SAM-dependent methyltransferase [Guptibacillus algicola]|uniref:class I SAM-dependent methyltransferase n=1 Tax=Guptibacillus algicola TaxID=225844 RepID=UPI001CD35846|nr:class I SAM-dependent methyltransferase [Alkalihalobacillus algicola]MCA0989351.1 class I SAM-dependent methyltransferase [Alkalihalobacillus algicola]